MKKVLLAGVALFYMICTLAVAAEDKPGDAAPDAAKILAGLQTGLKDVDSYKVLFTYNKAATGKDDKEFRVCEFWFMKGDFRRLEVVDGDEKGSKVAYNPEKSTKKVAAKASYMPFPITLKKDDRRLAGFFKSDWQADIDEILEFSEGADLSYGGTEEIEGRKAYKIVILPKAAALPEDRKLDKIILWIGEKENLLLKYEYYEGDKLVEDKTWSEIRLNAKLTARDFKP